MSLNSRQLRDIMVPNPEERMEVVHRRLDIQVVLHDVVDTYNVGSVFRLADAVGVSKVWLCGKTECPPNPRIDKSSVGTHRWVDWSYVDRTMSVIEEIKMRDPNINVVAIEQSEKSVGLMSVELELPLVLIVGNETDGISDEVLELSDTIIEMPMRGINKSLNVVVSMAMVIARIGSLMK